MTAKKKVTAKTWDDLKQQGSAHYKTGGVEPVDLFLAAGRAEDIPVKNADMDKIIDYAQKLKAGCGDAG